MCLTCGCGNDEDVRVLTLDTDDSGSGMITHTTIMPILMGTTPTTMITSIMITTTAISRPMRSSDLSRAARI